MLSMMSWGGVAVPLLAAVSILIYMALSCAGGKKKSDKKTEPVPGAAEDANKKEAPAWQVKEGERKGAAKAPGDPQVSKLAPTPSPRTFFTFSTTRS